MNKKTQIIIIYQYLASKFYKMIKKHNYNMLIELPDGIGQLKMIMNGKALLITREFYLHDPWLVITYDECHLWETREGYEMDDRTQIIEEFEK